MSADAQLESDHAVQQIEVPRRARALSTLAHVDYADAFCFDVDRGDRRTPEDWARTALELAPASVRRTLRSGWTAIGLKLDGAPPDRSVLGWEIRESTPGYVLLGAPSRIGMAGELLFERGPSELLFATLVQFDNPAARRVWAGVQPMHVPVVRSVLERASRRSWP
jgi:hypothetical protein